MDTVEKDSQGETEVVLVGHLTPSKKFGAGSSVAGNQVQLQILQQLSVHAAPGKARCYAMEAMPAWPRGPLIAPTVADSAVTFIGYLNLMVLKHLVFSLRLLFLLLRKKPRLTVQYNSYLFENCILIIYRLVRRKSVAALIIQDVHVDPEIGLFSKRGLRALSEKLSLYVARQFDFLVPISPSIVSDFNLPADRCEIFQGGATEFALNFMGAKNECQEDFAVFAGALEPHNGVDKLIKRWQQDDIGAVLHIFGRGSLTKMATLAAMDTKKIVFHGFASEETVQAWQQRARWNFCFRYSVGLNQRYFFPSKLFNILCAPGAVLANDFFNLPLKIRRYICLIHDDFSNLAEQLKAAEEIMAPDIVASRRQEVISSHSWNACVGKIMNAKRFKN